MISVIIPAYNAGRFIEGCINTIFNQTYRDFEIIVVNDGSSDNTLDILNSLAKKDARLKVISQKNGGVSAARNTALKHAKGEFITYVDADDSLPKTAFSDMLELAADDVDFVICSYNEITVKSRPNPFQNNVFDGPQDIYNRFRDFDRTIWWPCAKLYKTSIINENHLTYDTSITFGEDHIFNLLYSKYITGKVVVSEKMTYNYHHIRGGLTAKFYPDMDEMQKYVYTKIADYFGGADKIPKKYEHLYIGSYYRGLVEYYIAWLSREKAAKQIQNTTENTFADILTDDILAEYLTPLQFDCIKSRQYTEFVKDYTKHNPKATVYRKMRRIVRKTLEGLQKVFIK